MIEIQNNLLTDNNLIEIQTTDITYSPDVYAKIRERISELATQLEKYKNHSGPTEVIDPERLVPIANGISGSYYYLDVKGLKKFVIKPIDEDCGCINNPKGWNGLCQSSPVRDDMPLYRSSLKEAATYEIAASIGLTSIAPQTTLKIFESERFYYTYRLQTFKEKLCSVQEFIPNSKALMEIGNDPTDWDSTSKLSNFFFQLPEIGQCDLILSYIEDFDPLEDTILIENRHDAIEWLNKRKNEILQSTLSSSSSDCESEKENFSILQKIVILFREMNKINPTPIKEKLLQIFESVMETNLSTDISRFPSSTGGLIDLMLFYLEAFDLQPHKEKTPFREDRKRLIAELKKEKIRMEKSFTSSWLNESFSLKKLCSKEILSLFHKIIEQFQAMNQINQTPIYEAEKIIKLFQEVDLKNSVLLDQKQYEDLVILIWTTYDTDAHLGNILAYKLPSDKNGAPVYGLKKIDNGLNFPTKNRNLHNPIIFYPNGQEPLSEEGREKIRAMDEQALTKILSFYDLDTAIPAFRERLQVLKSLAEKPNITLKEIDSEMINNIPNK